MQPLRDPISVIASQAVWPTAESNQISKQAVRSVAPDENYLVLYPPHQLHTIRNEIEGGDGAFWHEFGALQDIPIPVDDALIIGDFGLGSETAIIVNKKEEDSPVFRLAWLQDGSRRQYWTPFFPHLSDLVRFISENSK